MLGRFSRWLRTLLSRSERLRMWYVERDLADLHRNHAREIADARRRNDTDAQEEIESRYSSEGDLVFEELEDIRTERLLRRARQLRVALPSQRPRAPRNFHELSEAEGDENWWLGHVLYQWNLTAEGESRLRMAIRVEEKAQRETAAFWFSTITTPLAVLTGLVGAIAVLISTQQKELSRLDHMPKIECTVAGERLTVANTGSRVKKMTVDRQVFFDVRPCVQPCSTTAPLVRYVVDDYYRDLVEGDFEGSQRLEYALAGPPGNSALLGKVSGLLQNRLPPRGFDWRGIETGVAVRIVYWDWVDTRMEEHYWGTSPTGVTPTPLVRVSRQKWKRLVAVADSLRRQGRSLAASTKTPDADAQRVLRECIAAARARRN